MRFVLFHLRQIGRSWGKTDSLWFRICLMPIKIVARRVMSRNGRLSRCLYEFYCSHAFWRWWTADTHVSYAPAKETDWIFNEKIQLNVFVEDNGVRKYAEWGVGRWLKLAFTTLVIDLFAQYQFALLIWKTFKYKTYIKQLILFTHKVAKIWIQFVFHLKQRKSETMKMITIHLKRNIINHLPQQIAYYSNLYFPSRITLLPNRDTECTELIKATYFSTRTS